MGTLFADVTTAITPGLGRHTILKFLLHSPFTNSLFRSLSRAAATMSNYLLFVLLASLEIAYNVIAVDNAKKPIRMNVMDAKAMFVTM